MNKQRTQTMQPHMGTMTDIFMRAFYDNNVHECEGYLDLNPGLVDTRVGPFSTPILSFAAVCGRVELCRLLLDRGADVHAGDMNKNTALHYLTKSRRVTSERLAICELLISHGADVRARNVFWLEAI